MVPTKHANVTQRLSGLSPKILGRRAAATAMFAACFAHAEQAPIAIAYEADPGCPTIEEFVRKVAQRAENVAVVPSQSPAAQVHVQLRASENMVLGRMELKRESGAYVRELVGITCDEAASVLAFVLAQTLLPERASDSTTDAGVEPRIVETTRTVIPPTVIDRPPPPPAGAPTRLEWWAAAEAGLRKVPVPSWALTEAAYVELRLGGTAGIVPSFELGVVHSGPAELTTPNWSARVSWLAGRAAICPARIALLPHINVVPCIGTHVGGFWASGTPSAGRGEARSETAPWVDVLAALRIDVHASNSVSLRLGFEAIAVGTRYDLAFDNPNTVAFPMPTVTGAASLGVVLKIW